MLQSSVLVATNTVIGRACVCSPGLGTEARPENTQPEGRESTAHCNSILALFQFYCCLSFQVDMIAKDSFLFHNFVSDAILTVNLTFRLHCTLK